MPDLTPAVPEEPTRFTVDAYFGLVEAGLLEADDRVELLEGVIVEMPRMNPPHACAIGLLADLLWPRVRDGAHVRIQMPLLAGRFSAPEPDLAVVAGAIDDYLAQHPSSALLVVEVSETTLRQDRLSKARIYAHAGIPEYWIVNLRDRVLEVSRDPDASRAAYRDLRTLGPGDTVEPVALPDVRIDVGAILPRPPVEAQEI